MCFRIKTPCGAMTYIHFSIVQIDSRVETYSGAVQTQMRKDLIWADIESGVDQVGEVSFVVVDCNRIDHVDRTGRVFY